MSTLAPVRPSATPRPKAAPAEPFASFDELLAALRERRREFSAQRQLSPDIVAGFKRHGVYRMLVPRRLGGDERSPREFCERIETIARADGSAGWVASFGMGVTYLAGLPLATLQQIYADGPDVVFAGGLFPPQAAARVDGGYEVSGRWHFASGCTGADVVGVGIVPPRAEGAPALPRMAVMPRAKATVVPNWDVIGMAGTGSHDLVVDKVVVPDAWTFLRGARATLDEPMFRYPSLSFATQVLAVVGLGIARAAIEELRGMATGRVSITGAPVLADRPVVQMELAKCEAELRAARAFFYESIDEAWAMLLRGDERVADEEVNLLRLSSTHAARTAADVTRRIQMQTGMTGIQESCPISTQVRDSLVLTQHAFLGDITYQNAGAMLVGQKPLPGYL